ncbi:metallopeptidase TldD-related protein [Clostridium sp. BNL1100]|uniref:metallopeptidase TldD-related protein n=1 Tax=Clostridium sp. BNL1100 TaxID=755731 RepID=UPI00024A7B18|nr:metallopeptidase TldD-related protein [Clostridium sp. BNL1100]AEY64432.1 putative Zn-dependent protease-like protein [Clostridium sp. BNL1100]
MKELYSIRTIQTSINVSGSRIKSVRGKDITKTGLRIYDGGFIGVSGAIGNYRLEDLEKNARSALKAKIEYPYELNSNKIMEIDVAKEIIKDEDFVYEIEEAIEQLGKNHNGFIFSNKINMDNISVSLCNDKGLDLRFKDRAIDVELVFKEKSSASIMDGFIGFKDRRYDRNDFLSMSDEILSAYKNRVDFTEGNYPVVFLTVDETPLLKFISDLNGRSFGTDTSLFSGKLEKKLFSKEFTLYNSLNPEDTSLMSFFDSEGTFNESYRYPLIEDGILKAANTDKKNAALYKLPYTGSAVSAFDGTPQPGFPNPKVKESDKTAKELLGGDKGIMVLMASGGDFTPQGDFATPVQLAYLFDGEKLLGRLPEIQVSSNVFEMYGSNYRGVSKNVVWPLGGIKSMIMDMKVNKI